jgi:hypothetical protein
MMSENCATAGHRVAINRAINAINEHLKHIFAPCTLQIAQVPKNVTNKFIKFSHTSALMGA